MRFLPDRQEKPGDEHRKTSEEIEKIPIEGDVEKKEDGALQWALPSAGREKIVKIQAAVMKKRTARPRNSRKTTRSRRKMKTVTRVSGNPLAEDRTFGL